MLYQILYFFLAAFCLGFLVFIHELGHYIMARRVGMTVEAFAIGFGKPLLTWKHKGVKWQICLLPFGGYVKIKGMEKEGKLEPHEIPDGFFGKKPWARIKVAFMGPFVNIVFAFFAFSLIWMGGGRDKPFSEYTRIVGWVEPSSEIYELGVRPGDQIVNYDGHNDTLLKDLTYAALMGNAQANVSGYRYNYPEQTKEPFDVTVSTYVDPRANDKSIRTTGIMSPANYLLFASPVEEYNIEKGDRLLWTNGELLFSQEQLSTLINEKTALLTVQRGDHVFLTKVPRVAIRDIRLSPKERGNLDDWKNEANVAQKLDSLLYIPYTIDREGNVQSALSYVDEKTKEHPHLSSGQRSSVDQPLEAGDRVLAVDGIHFSSALQFFQELQTKHVQIIVQKNPELPIESWKTSDQSFDRNIEWSSLKALSGNVGFEAGAMQQGDLTLISSITPKTFAEFLTDQNQQGLLLEQEEKIEKISDPAVKEQALRSLEKSKQRLVLGMTFQDQKVSYNPTPFVLFGSALDETGRTLKGLFSGSLNPKWMSGPIGIVQVMHHGWSLGVNEALYWMGFISLGLAVLNLLPIPILDGGHICFALYEQFTRRKIKAKTMQRLIIPFFVLLVGFIIFVTYQDISRIIHRFF